jgi:hypothetical protein
MPKSDRLARILESPALDRLVPRLQPEVLHQLIERRGLEDCADIVARATPAQLVRVFDLDLWRSTIPGQDETLDADRFGVWLDVLMESGAAVAAEKLMGADVDLVIAALAQHLRVFDRAAVVGSGFEIGAYLVQPTHTASWDSIVELLLHLDADRPDYFNQLMAGCRRLSNAGFEIDGLHDLLSDADQNLFDLAFARQQRREKQGYVTPAEARAFLQLARERPRDPGQGPNPVATAYFQALAPTPGLARAREDVQSARELEELAFLANALMAGCSIDGRAFRPEEASGAAAATCKLGAENSRSDEHDLIRAFEIGWRILHEDVCLAAATRLNDVLSNLRAIDRDIDSGVAALRFALAKFTSGGEPWRARDALDVVMIFDMTTWAALRGLIAECPVIHAAMRTRGSYTVSASDFEFISENAQLAAIRNFLDTLPALLSP